MLALYIVSGIAGFILFIILLLCIPVDLTFDLDVREEVRSRTKVRWLLGLVQRDLAGDEKKPGRKPKKKKKPSIKPFLSMLSLLGTKGVPGGLIKLARQSISRFKIKQLDADVKIGLDDPADTAMLFSVLWPAMATIGSYSPIRVGVEPSFDKPALEFGLRGRIRLFPIQLVGPVLRFALSRAGLRAMRKMVVSSWKSRK